jgi:MoaA/NifB/PqqE/SkfB family radical SAM enzyme
MKIFNMMDFKKSLENNETFCFYPFLEISTRPNGVVLPCCYWNANEHFYSIDKISDSVSIIDLWNSARLVNIRKSMAEGQKLQGCNICYRDGAASMRVRSLKESINNFEHLKLVKDTIDNNGVAPHLPRRLELKPSNLCNLKCISCCAYDSSQIESELKKLDEKYGGIKTHGGRYRGIVGNKPGVWEGDVGEYTLPNVADLNWAESERFWEDMKVILPRIEVLSFAGGEPTLNPIVQKILQYCVDMDYDKNITVFISSNFTNLKQNFFELMHRFKRFELIASIDGINEVQEYVRFPSDWNTVKRNFEMAKTYMEENNTKLLTNITVSILNICYLVDLLDYLDSTDKVYPPYHQWPYNINLINSPLELRIDLLPESMRTNVIKDLEDYKTRSHVIKRFNGLSTKIDLLINELRKPYDKDFTRAQTHILKTTLDVLDKHRNQNYSHSLPKLAEIIKINEQNS